MLLLSIFSVAFVMSASTSHATVSLMMYDEHTKTMGMLYATSGGRSVHIPQWQVFKHNKGLIAGGGYGICSNAKANELLQLGFSAAEVARQISERCANSTQYYRLAIVTSDGKLHAHIAKAGCSSSYGECGFEQNANMVIVGGGLQAGVLKGTLQYLETIDPRIPMPCKLHLALQKICALGGEISNFYETSILVDSPSQTGVLTWSSISPKTEALQLRSLWLGLLAGGYRCTDSQNVLDN